MLVDGRSIAEEIRIQLKKTLGTYSNIPTLGIVVVGSDPVTESFVRIKKKFGAALGVTVRELRLPVDVTEELLKIEVTTLSNSKDIDGVVVQLPLPAHIDAQVILNMVPITKDVDMLSLAHVSEFAKGSAKILPPVAGAVQVILERYNISVVDKEVLVLGYGRLVGKPVSILLRHNHARVTVIDKPVSDLATHVRESDVVVTGVGIPSIIKPEMLSAHTVLIDAGASEHGGKIIGDVDASCVSTAALLTPVPGGVGPIAVALLFKNLLILARHRQEVDAKEEHQQ